jgi:hypothetical protein
MPIWSDPQDQTKARYIRDKVGGNQVHFGLDPNPKLKASYCDKGVPIQHDRAFVTGMPNVNAADFKHLIKEMMDEGYTAVTAVDQHVKATNPPTNANGTKTGAATTATIALYDPGTFRLEIGSKGDSPAFFILDDGKKPPVVIKITSEKDGGDNITHSAKVIFNSLNYPSDPAITNPNYSHMPVREAIYVIDRGPGNTRIDRTGTINIEALIDDAADVYGLDAAALKQKGTHLLVASDGIVKTTSSYPALGTPFGGAEESERILQSYQAAKASRATNIVEAMFKPAMIGKDNLSAVFIQDIAKGRGRPMAAVICDGYNSHGCVAAQTAVETMENVIRREIGRLNPPNVAAVYQPPRGPSRRIT